MTTYWIIVALLLVTAILLVAIPLWRGRVHGNAVQRDKANLEIFRDQIAEMDADLRNGLLSQEMYEQGKQELQGRLLSEVKQTQAAGVDAIRHPYRILAVVLAVLMPVAAFSFYAKIGNPHAVEVMAASGNEGGAAMTEAGLAALRAQVESRPEDGESLYKLAQAYLELGHYEQASMALERLTGQYPNEAQLWADYADALAMASGRSLTGKPTELINHALKLDPENYKALALAGTAAMERHDYAAAVNFWKRLLKLIPPENENHVIIATGIQKAQELLAQSGGGKAVAAAEHVETVAGKEAISGTVTLSAKLKAQASPEDTVFVLARAAEGPRMPLAIMRKQVKDLPVQFKLDDSMAMSPQMKLSNFDRIVIVAKISKSGNAMTQPGDLQGTSSTVKPGSRGLKVVIDQAVQ